MKLKLFVAIFLLLVVVTSGCLSNQPQGHITDDGVRIDLSDYGELESSQELKKFNNRSEVVAFLSASGQQGGEFYSYRGGGDFIAVEQSIAVPLPAPAPAMGGELGLGSTSATEYSTTNIQVAGVDEADFVKNDGKYIYIVSQEKLVIVDAYPADDAEIVSKTEIEGTPRDMFVNGDRLAIFSQDYDDVYVIADYDFVPRRRSVQTTHLYVYDISDRSNPEEVKDYSVTGGYYQSRMIGDYVYFITTEYPYYYGGHVDLPVIRESTKIIVNPDIYYFDNPEYNYNFNTVASVDITSDADDVNAKSFLMGHSNNLYVSQDNIYITYQKNQPYRYYDTLKEERFTQVVLPLLPTEIRNKIENILEDDSLNSYERWDQISSVLEDMYNEMDEDDKDDLIEEIEEAVLEWDAKLEAEMRKTVIQKIAIDDGEIEYRAKGEVEGYPLNQFSMDEDRGYFRIATTTNFWTRGLGSVQYNNVFVLDDDMEIVGSLEKLAKDERIYSTRFIGDRLYMVTFERIDPLFVIDLSDPTDPEVLGELKIPGFSDYLHPYDEDHIIGIGKETGSNEWGGVSIKGVKLALFDVSDVEHPKEIDKVEIGDSGTDSEALREHKAFLFDKEKNILVIPIREVKDDRFYDSDRGYYRQRVWQGAYVFGLTPEDGFELKGKISHFEGDEDENWYWQSPSAVRRSLYMDDVLYTISAKYIKMNDMGDIDEEINEVKLPYREDRYYPIPYW
ncbi:MAG: beta-propeller domain-containing protein [Halobacteriota archaeon]|nr:beta-propeller domain-containing protein [Halobacteriota archaeon]